MRSWLQERFEQNEKEWMKLPKWRREILEAILDDANERATLEQRDYYA